MIRLWLRDGRTPKCLAADSLPRLPEGSVVDVTARSLTEALEILRVSSRVNGPKPDTTDFETLWNWHAACGATQAAQSLIREVPRA